MSGVTPKPGKWVTPKTYPLPELDTTGQGYPSIDENSNKIRKIPRIEDVEKPCWMEGW
jgi:hypothetical protein